MEENKNVPNEAGEISEEDLDEVSGGAPPEYTKEKPKLEDFNLNAATNPANYSTNPGDNFQGPGGKKSPNKGGKF